jgi:glycosyltransferase involved in cell wall biosynthesis
MYKTDPSNYLCTLHPRIDGYICVSDAVKANVLSKIRESIRKSTRTIYKGHDLKWYTESPTDLSPLGVFDNDFCVLCVGSAREHKGMRYMIEATRYLTDIENFKLILVGDGFDCEPFSTEIKNTGMSDKIIQTGFRNDVPQLAGACKCLILPSLREGLPRTILESLAYGTPVITSDCGGPTEIIEEGTNGYIVPVGDAKAIADRIRLLIGNNELLEQLSNNAKKTISVKMSHAQTVTNMEQYFKDILR